MTKITDCKNILNGRHLITGSGF